MASDEMLIEALEALEQVGCQFEFCNGPTLEPVDMQTCFVCVTLARGRHHLGLPVRKDAVDSTWQERHDAMFRLHGFPVVGDVRHPY